MNRSTNQEFSSEYYGDSERQVDSAGHQQKESQTALAFAASQQQQAHNRYAHLVSSGTGKSGPLRPQAQAGGARQHSQSPKPPPLKEAVTIQLGPKSGGATTTTSSREKSSAANASEQNYRNNYYQSFSSVDWREQWILLKEKTLEKVGEPKCQRKLIMLIVCTALLLDNMLYMVIVPIIPDYLRSIGAWSTYTENAKWILRNSSHGRPKWEQVGGQTVYEGEDSAVGFLFASKAIVQLIANPFSGALADRIGYEIPMMIGLVVMFLSTMVFACGQTYSVLFLARSLQGVGSAFADTPGIAMLADRFTEETERRRAQGIAIAFISFGCLVAPPFGSVLYQGAGKEVPFILLSLVCLIDSSLLLLVAPPGTFSVLWPRGFGGGVQPPGLGSKRTSQTAQMGTEAESVRRLQQQQQQQQPEQVALQTVSGSTLASTEASHTDADAIANKKRALLARQKSISRRHSMTMSAGGEAPKGTPIEVLLRDRCIACCAGALVVANISLAFLEPTLSIWVKNNMPDTEEWQEGLIWLPAFFPHVLGVFATLHFAEKYPQSTWKIAASGLVIEGLGCLVVPFCSSFWSLIVPISVICFGIALIDTAILPTLGYLVDTRFTSVYGNVYAIADISYSLSYAIGPIIAGGVVEAIGFTALNVLIAIVTLGYTPLLMMLSTIRDYQPFEADSSGRQKELAQPFGKYGRTPQADVAEMAPAVASPLEEEDEEDESEYADRQHGFATAGRPTGASWGSSSSFKKSESLAGGARVLKSVKIIESHEQQQQQPPAPPRTTSTNPFQ